MTLAAVGLDDKYTADTGRVFLTGTQALVRLPMMQRRRDAADGFDTACFVSGYRGSPLGGLDRELWRAGGFLDTHHIRFQPGVNEDLAATAVWGSQQAGLSPGARYDGVFGMWYGKGPGVDRSGDVIKHGNLAGSSRHGGVLLLAGDDHLCKSSTTAHQSEFAFVDASIPVLHPAGVQEIVDFGLYGWALSRYSGCWVALKLVTDLVDSSASVAIDPGRVDIVLPTDFALPADCLNIRWPDNATDQEDRLRRYKLDAARAFVRANGLDRVVLDAPRRRLGIVTTGKSYLDVRQALDNLGIDQGQAAALGLAIYKVAMPWPLEPEGAREFAESAEEILVVEEKRALIESQLKEQLYHMRADARPRIIGKLDETGADLLPSTGELTPDLIALVIVERLQQFGHSAAIERRLSHLNLPPPPAVSLKRVPYFCSGCPHNVSTRVPEGSRALAGIGCHYMAMWMDRATETFTHMGAEGVNWVGQAPFTDEPHVFVNLGDGTYFHSGSLAIRQAVAAGVQATYKILYNDAVAMTGGQPVDGQLSVAQITQQLHAEGVRRIAVVAETGHDYPPGADFAHGVTHHTRQDFDQLQRELRGVPGVSVLIYDQTCAAEKRRRRKRGLMPDPPVRALINEAVCEGCGDCSTKSNCLSVVPLDTEFGRKRAIDQASCNKDMACVDGFCPSFVTVHGGTPRKSAAIEMDFPIDLPEPALPALDAPYGILITGIGGTGVVTIGALLAMAAHLEAKGCTVLDMTGLAQKGGAVVSHVRIGRQASDIHAARLSDGGAHALIAGDLVVAASAEAQSKLRAGVTRAVVNSHHAITGDFTRDPDMEFPKSELEETVASAVGEAHFDDVTRLARALTGEAMAANVLLLGVAWQRGLLPLSLAAIERAIELNGVAVEQNRRAFTWGRRIAVAPDRIAALIEPPPQAAGGDLYTVIARRAEFLRRYQDEAYARRYREFVARVRKTEAARAPGKSGFAEAVARNYFKLLAYKDEYEVARLFTDGGFKRRLEAQFEGEVKLRFHLAPPLLSRRDPATGLPRKSSYGGWMMVAFRLLAKFKRLRGTRYDPFGYTSERRAERELIAAYEATIEELAGGLSLDNHALAVDIAAVPERIRGFGHVKLASIARETKREATLLKAFRNPPGGVVAAE